MKKNTSFIIIVLKLLQTTMVNGFTHKLFTSNRYIQTKYHNTQQTRTQSHPTFSIIKNQNPKFRFVTTLQNIYDDWKSDSIQLFDTLELNEENVMSCLDELIESNYGRQMFGKHDLPARHGITGMIEFVELNGPEVILHLSGSFWHKRGFVLGCAAMYLNARIPEITDVIVEDINELNDFEEVRDDFTGDIIQRMDLRSPDFNGDRAALEYQGIDPDNRGPFGK